MSAARKQEFETWYQEKTADPEYVFDFQQELWDYCVSNVHLLKEGCLTFCRDFEVTAGFNPMEHCLTIASACNVAYRRNWMPKKTIAVEPLRGWRATQQQSKVALEWLHVVNRDLNHQIVHAGNSGEVRLSHGADNFLVDGYVREPSTVYEFHGCFYHGCPTCFPNRYQKHPKHFGLTMHEVYAKTLQKTSKLRQHGYTVVEKWECDFKNDVANNPTIADFVETLKFTDPLEPRHSFFGGRTNAVTLHAEAEEDEEIRYVDFTSLYPWVNKNGEYPKGHPTFIDQPGHTDISQFFGIVKCDVLPPKQLFHPVLPVTSNGKLTFTLCRTCVAEEQPKALHKRKYTCRHSEEQRMLTGTWCSEELKVAVAKGYVIRFIYEALHWPENQRSTELFTQYVNTWLKTKQESSGWPAWVGNDPVKRRQYIDDYERIEGIRLDYDRIEKNAGLRSLAKLMLNSFWGKFGQRSNKSQVINVTDPALLIKLIQDDSLEIQRVVPINDYLVEIFFRKREQCDEVQTNTNIFIAVFTTTYARLKLYRALDQLQQQVLYMDTDSVIYRHKTGQPEVELGDYLGDFTSELEEGEFIQEFVSGGPKNYAYVTNNGKQVCKVRGFTLNTRGQRVLNFQSIRNHILEEITDPLEEPRVIVTHDPYKITRDQKEKNILTIEQSKQYKLVFDKRVLDKDTFKSYPYGYA